MGKSTKSPPAGKRVSKTPENKPEKPYLDYPLFPHATGRWAKKIRQATHFFGRWGRKDGSRIVPVDDVPASAAAAKLEFDRQWPYLSQGRTVPPVDGGAHCTMKVLCNAFMRNKQNRMNTGELSPHSYSEYHRTCDRLIEFFGRERRLDDLRPDDFERFRAVLAKGCNVVTLKSKINRCRIVLKYASDNELIERPIKVGTAFDRPSDMVIRKARQSAGSRMFEADEIRKLLAEADTTMKAAILLGVNCGYGNTDIATLPRSELDLKAGWATFARPKTGMPRKAALWPETIAAVRKAIEDRPAPKDPADEGLCFLTVRGTRFVRVQESKRKPGHHVTINALSRAFELVMARAKVEGRRGLNFYGLRHSFRTVADESHDTPAIDLIMGHAPAKDDMGSQYRERIDDARLRAVSERVRAWLFPAKRKAR